MSAPYREPENEARLKSLRDAVRVGSSDVEAGRVREFGSNAELSAYLDELVHRSIRKAPEP